MVPGVEVSFTTTNLNTADRLPASLASIRALGDALGAEYEVVVADGPSGAEAKALLHGAARADPRVRLVEHDQRSRGHGRRLAFEASRGSTIIPFDTSLQYAPLYAELLRRWRGLRTDRMLFSEVCALSRRSIEASGGWRDLIGGEDVDLYGRVVDRFGLLAYPTPIRQTQSAAIGAYARQMRYVSGSRWARFQRIYTVQRDQIIGADYRVADLMAFNATKPWGRRVAYRAFFTLAAAGARLRPIRPVHLAQNHYLAVREATLRSMLDGSYHELGWDGPGPKLLLTPDEVTYLERRSPLWAAERERLRGFYELK
jgi:glycosyltransferase involved in cell wall biosynthesis